jgi:hypothetical protein
LQVSKNDEIKSALSELQIFSNPATKILSVQPLNIVKETENIYISESLKLLSSDMLYSFPVVKLKTRKNKEDRRKELIELMRLLNELDD